MTTEPTARIISPMPTAPPLNLAMCHATIHNLEEQLVWLRAENTRLAGKCDDQEAALERRERELAVIRGTKEAAVMAARLALAALAGADDMMAKAWESALPKRNLEALLADLGR